jgi:hypothetical protein
MREAWPYAPPHRFLVFDRDTKFGNDVIPSRKRWGSQPVRTAFRSPWQNAERQVRKSSFSADQLSAEATEVIVAILWPEQPLIPVIDHNFTAPRSDPARLIAKAN